MNLFKTICLLLTISCSLHAVDELRLKRINSNLAENIIKAADAIQRQASSSPCPDHASRSSAGTPSPDQECARIFDNPQTHQELTRLADILRTQDDATPVMHLIAERGLSNALGYLIRNPSQMNITFDALQQLLEQSINRSRTPLATAIQFGQVEVVEHLLRLSATVNQELIYLATYIFEAMEREGSSESQARYARIVELLEQAQSRQQERFTTPGLITLHCPSSLNSPTPRMMGLLRRSTSRPSPLSFESK